MTVWVINMPKFGQQSSKINQVWETGAVGIHRSKWWAYICQSDGHTQVKVMGIHRSKWWAYTGHYKEQRQMKFHWIKRTKKEATRCHRLSKCILYKVQYNIRAKRYFIVIRSNRTWFRIRRRGLIRGGGMEGRYRPLSLVFFFYLMKNKF